MWVNVSTLKDCDTVCGVLHIFVLAMAARQPPQLSLRLPPLGREAAGTRRCLLQEERTYMYIHALIGNLPKTCGDNCNLGYLVIGKISSTGPTATISITK